MGHIVPDAYRVVVVIESIGHRVQKLLGLFSPFPQHVLQPAIQHQPASRGQPELRAIFTRDEACLLLTVIALGFEPINAFVEALEKVRILNLGRLAI